MNWEAGRPTCSVTGRLAWPLSRMDPRRQLTASSVWFWASRGRQADSTVTSIGSAASLMNVPGCVAKGLASLPAACCDFQDWEGLLHSPLLEFHCSVCDGAQGGWTGSHRTPMAAAVASACGARFVCSFGCGFSPVGLSPQGLPGKPLGARHQAMGLGPAGPLFAHPSWKWAQREG